MDNNNVSGRPATGKGHSVVVVGSCFLDYIAYVERTPLTGETLRSSNFKRDFGGKGANQAVSAGRLGANVTMVSALGSDGDGEAYISSFSQNSVDTSFLYRVPGGSTGLAMILVETSTSRNQITICPNATNDFTVKFLREKSNNYDAFLSDCRFLVCQNEIPLETTLDVLKEASTRGVYTVFNAAPAPPPDAVSVILPFLPCISLFCVNEPEATMISGIEVTDAQSARLAAAKLQQLGVRDVVVTLGENGCVVSEKGGEVLHVPGNVVKAVDSTGAGDCFLGAMVYYMSVGKPLAEACRRANIVASISVQRRGTQQSFPTLSELPHELQI
ncbi:putative pfkB family carbohydrate kinase Phosphomethylpyrimidine kinase [Trypanosoma vivax]|uniref:Ribokinase n=1 Tax=Trypanosoma vivax (strain Y486) TaxID=1055687 RepID=G0U9X4_TRYVY|nr:putative ribokinase [Trypanosoma vivax]KAH8619051.1 putative pfkB family carbohydrate kinase Phosphomethylpyrimidine kinase [Trypanosoma vivax]CCC52605.1 putative ribokinase [Trypanosoma vivax Y486]